MAHRPTLAIIGGGSVGVSYFCQLIQALGADPAPVDGAPPRILIFEPQAQVGPGGAYAADLDSNLLNVTAGGMSAFGDDKLHFMRWLSAQGITRFNGRPIVNDSFVSRPLFGRYLGAVYLAALDQAAACGIGVEHVRAVVDDVLPASGGALAVSAGGRLHPVDHIVLAIGNLPAVAYAHWQGNQRYLHSPYPVSRFATDLPADASIAIAGTSLSAIDTIVALAAQGHQGKIFCVSRSGRLPTVRGVHNQPITLPAGLQALIAQKEARGESLSLDEAIVLLAHEVQAAGASHADILDLLKPCASTLDYIDAEIRIASTQPRQWQALGNILNGVIDRLWYLLPQGDRVRFQRELRPLWLSRRVAFPMENALTLQKMLRSGQLLISGGLHKIEFMPERERFALHLQGGQTGTIEADFLINATSFSDNAALSELPLLKNLLRSGMAVVDSFGGLKLDFASGKIIDRQQRVNPAISVLGSM
ncbi:MAG: FAD/NAD(P)-binding protein, partial [Lacisediminimonas sp.]|nr:FAD/NAD(P)-binding protein [Lacisediminimonas sp.]